MGQYLSRHVPLKNIVSLALDQFDKSEGDQDRLWILGMRALVQLNQQFTALPKTIRLPVQPNMTVNYPPDLLSWVKIGIMDEKGQVNTLKINNSLTTFRDNNPNRLSALTADINDGIGALTTAPFFLNFYNNGSFSTYYGVQGGLVQYGECRVDDKNKVIILNTDFKYSSILLEYISAPEMDPDFTVDIVLQEAIIAFIAWKLKLGPREDWIAEQIIARRSLPGKKITLQEINQFIRETSGGYLHA